VIKIANIFDEQKVKEVEKDFNKIELTPGQKGIIGQSAQLLSQFLPLSVMAIKGNTWFVIKEWQNDTKQTMADMAKMTPEEMLKTVQDLFERGKKRMRKLLINPDEQQQVVDEAYQKAYELYLEYAQKRDKKKNRKK
jgi:hypothetical protein